jgi:thioesterase domain-containing protein
MVFFPGVDGVLAPLQSFPQLFGADQPVHLAEAVGADPSDTIREPTVEKIADVYERELLEILAPGLVVLIGFSFGAMLAFEMTRRLVARGFEVPVVVSIEGWAPGYPAPLPAHQRIWAHLRYFALAGRDDRRMYLRDRYDRIRARAWSALGQEHRQSEHTSSMTPEMRLRVARIWRMNIEAIGRYRPPAIDGTTMLVIRAESVTHWVGVARLDESHGWSPLVSGRVSVVTVSGGHSSIIHERNQRAIVDAIREHLPAGW